MRLTSALWALPLIGLITACSTSTEGEVQQVVDNPDQPLTLFTPSDLAIAAVPARPNGVGADNYLREGEE